MKKYAQFIAFVIMAVFSHTFVSCGDNDDEPKITYNNITMDCKTTHTIKGDDSWTSSNKYIASVSGNTLTAERVGKAIISSKNNSFTVTVTPTVSVFKEPCLEWGASKSRVKSFMSGYTLDKEMTNQLNYKGTGSLILATYNFQNDGLSGAAIGLNGDYVNSEALIEQMTQYYIPIEVDESNYSFYFITPDEKTLVLLKLASSGSTIIYAIIYVPRSNSSSRATSEDLETIISTIGISASGNPSEKFNEMKSHLF